MGRQLGHGKVEGKSGVGEGSGSHGTVGQRVCGGRTQRHMWSGQGSVVTSAGMRGQIGMCSGEDKGLNGGERGAEARGKMG